MSKKCARCDKTVYPTEELKCLDKTWHKICFKCKECNMTLNMRNYKGFNKEPYCEAHIPKAKATTMAETPELRRIAANTKNQSNISYHADFEASKGKFTQVADDPEMMRIKQNTQIISNVAYHGDLARKAEMEQRRQLNENGYSESAPPSNYTRETIPAAPVVKMQQPTMVDPRVDHKNANMVPPSYQPPPQVVSHHQQHSSVGKISDYEPNAASVVSPYSAGRQDRQTLIYSSDRGGSINNPPQSNIGSVHDMDPVNHNYGSLGSRNEPYGNAPPSTGRVYRAMYDYEAQDVDEVSFHDGDLIVNVSSIDGGWMTGQVQRTGKMGMLPANYVKLATI